MGCIGSAHLLDDEELSVRNPRVPALEIQRCNFNHLPRAPVATWHHEAQLSTTDSRKSPASPQVAGSADKSLSLAMIYLTRPAPPQ